MRMLMVDLLNRNSEIGIEKLLNKVLFRKSIDYIEILLDILLFMKN